MENMEKLFDPVDTEEYKAFEEKFKPKRTTDDCFTPPAVYEAVLEWVREEWDIADDVPIVRPFYPGGDYENYKYPPNCIVVDNPPFSLSAKIRNFYNKNGIRFFLFAPTLTLCSGGQNGTNYIVAGAQITYENGARVNTSFATNLPGAKLRVCGPLHEKLKRADKETNKGKELPKYDYPGNVTSAARLQKLARGSVDIEFQETEIHKISKLEKQKGGIFGSGYLISDKAAERLREAERIKSFELSEREKAIIVELNNRSSKKTKTRGTE